MLDRKISSFWDEILFIWVCRVAVVCKGVVCVVFVGVFLRLVCGEEFVYDSVCEAYDGYVYEVGVECACYA